MAELPAQLPTLPTASIVKTLETLALLVCCMLVFALNSNLLAWNLLALFDYVNRAIVVMQASVNCR